MYPRYFLILLIFSVISFPSCDKEVPIIKIVEEPLFIPPAENWWNDQVFYQINVRSFYDTDANGVGDFQGLIQKLDYLNDGNPNTDTDLGITAIWLMPIMSSPSDHGFDVTDYYNVNFLLGNMSDFENLVSEVHKRGMKIIIDFEINHTSDRHPWFINSSDPAGEKRNWYIWSTTQHGEHWHPKNDYYYYGYFWGVNPDLNYRNDAVTEEMKKIISFWHQDKQLDGFRMDAANLIIEEGDKLSDTQSTLNWWRKFYAFQKNLNPALMTVGEIWRHTDIVAPFADQRLDFCFEFSLSYCIIDAIKYGDIYKLKNQLDYIVDAYPRLQYGIFLKNHDQNRVLEEFDMNIPQALLAARILLTLPGIPFLYYGEEIGMRGLKLPDDNRGPMQWSDEAFAGFSTIYPWEEVDPGYVDMNVRKMKNDPHSMWHEYRRYIKARLTNRALTWGDYEPINTFPETVFSFLRHIDDEIVLVIHHIADQKLTDPEVYAVSSSLTGGLYAVYNIIDSNELGELTVDSNGGFNASSIIGQMEPYSTMMFRIELN